jgi:hypothetical protein
MTVLRRRLAVIALCGLIAAACAVWSVSAISLAPPGIAPRALDIAAAATRVSVDLPAPLAADGLATEYDYETIQRRTVLVATLATAEPAIEIIARRAGIDRDDLAATTPVTSGVQTVFTEPDSERRADQIANAGKPYRLELRAGETLPTIDVYTQGPTVAGAERLADAVVPGMHEYLAGLAEAQGTDPENQVQLVQLGPARGAIVNGGTKPQIALLTFIVAFALSGAAAFGLSRWRARRAAAPAADELSGEPPPAELLGGPAATIAGRAVRRAGDWPRTTRVLPWLIAFLMAIVFLVPFNDIMLDVALPIDLYLDRLVLPVIIGVWAIAFAAGGAYAPRLRITWIHVAIGAVVGIAGLSVVLAARDINHALEWELSIKKLALLGSYVALFVIVASSIRRSEVHAFLTYTLILASVCAVGVIIEYRFGLNIFYKVADATLPGVFQIGDVNSTAIDEIGRRNVRGPAQASLEAVAMMAMVLPVAIARLLQSRRSRERLRYAIAVAIVMAGIVATFRKSAFLAPISVGLTIAYFRRRELIKLAPLGVVLVIMVQVLSPGALTGVAGQLDSNKLGVNTVSDRSADYDSIRPDVWTHLFIGRGYGSYEPTSYRILDMELLRQLIEVGVIGLLAYVGMAVTVVAVARRPIRSRDLDDAPVALAAAAAAVCFLVVSTLFDVMSFPHVPYIFLWMAAMLAVVTSEPRAAPALRPAAVPRLVREPQPEPAWSS